MSEVYYRKWRPRTMDQVVGQEPIMQTLRQAVLLNRVAHAYLFCGPRGTGKTSTARILAKAINCLSPRDGEPDNECEICQSINEGRALDLIEIDAASNRGIDDIRDLSEKIHFTPNEARYKVYIIDEVHMLTEPAFNALLKTLEEPPAHAIFVLATTEAHKVPLTIISRCQRFDFRRIPLDRTIDKLAEICRAEGVEVSQEALTLISRTSAGGLRDAENLLEQAVVSYGSPVNEEQVRDLLGLGGDEDALHLAGHIANKAIKEGLTIINEVAAQGSDLRQLHRGVVEYLRAALLIKTDVGTALGYSDEVTAELKAVADSAPLDHIVRALKNFAKADLRRDSSSPLPLELAMVEVATQEPQVASAPPPASVAPVSTGQRVVEERPRYAPSSQEGSTPPRQPPPARPAQPSSEAKPPASSYASTGAARKQEEAAPQMDSSLEGQLRQVARALRHVGKKYKVGALLNVCKEAQVNDGELMLKFSHVSNMERMREEMEDPQTRRALKEAIAQVMGDDYDVKIGMVNGSNGVPGKSAAQNSHLVSAAIKMGARVVEEKEDQPQ